MGTFQDQMLAIYNDYLKEHNVQSATIQEIYPWAVENGRWEPQPSTVRRQFSQQMADALREHFIVDPQGERVRAKHAIVSRIDDDLFSEWFDMRNCTRDKMETSVRQKRRGITGELLQVKKSVDSYNRNWNDGEQIRLILDFSADIAEVETATVIEKVSSIASGRHSGQSHSVGRKSTSSRVPSRPSGRPSGRI
jgi:hypothetical protein